MTKETNQPTKVPAIKEQTNITEQVLARIKQHQAAGLRLPGDYSPENALKSAYLVLQEVKDKTGKLAIDSCTKVSVANSLFEMVVRGLSPLKKQCYFIAYGEKLTLSPSYFGNIATARRVGLKNIVANIIYQGDDFIYSVDTATGRQKVEKHVQKLENIDINKIKGAYAVIEMETGETDIEVMTIQQVKQAWLQGAAKGNSGAHNNFSDEMARKSVINRACKRIINSSDDSYLFEGTEQPPVAELQPGANSQEIGFTEAEDVTEKGNHTPEPLTDPEPKEEKELELTGEDLKKKAGF
jgi:recombination protein RecT